jgi:hypothetical protein
MTDPLSQRQASRAPTQLPYDASDVVACVEDAIREIREGRMVILVDDPPRRSRPRPSTSWPRRAGG